MSKLVKDIMTPAAKLITATKDTPITEIAEILYKHSFNGIPVIEEDFELVGMVSQRDLIVGSQHVYLPTFLNMMEGTGLGAKQENIDELKQLNEVTAGKVMKTKPYTVHPSMPVEELAKVLAEEHINPVPVVELGKLVGIAARSDVVKMLVPGKLHIKPREEIPGGTASLEPLLQKAVVKFEKGYMVVDRLRVRLWWVFILAAFIIGFIISIAWIISINF
jgi:CBS domain-containing protein